MTKCDLSTAKKILQPRLPLVYNMSLHEEIQLAMFSNLLVPVIALLVRAVLWNVCIKSSSYTP